MPQRLRLIAAKGQHNGAFRIWYGAADNDQSPFVLTLTPQHVAQALHKALPVTLEEIEEYADKTATASRRSRAMRAPAATTPKCWSSCRARRGR
jgi:hypothetical protein